MSNIEKEFFYHPDLSIKHDYYSEGEYLKETPVRKEKEQSPEIDALLVKADQVIRDLIKIYNILPFLPEKLYKILKDIIEKLTFQTIIEENELKKQKIIEEKEEAEEKYVDKYEEDTEKNISSKIEMDGDKALEEDIKSFLDELGPSGFSVEITRVRSNMRLARDQYLRDSLMIKEDFTKKMGFSLSQYVYPLLNVMTESSINKMEYLNYDYDATSVKGINSDCQHLSDIIVRAQIVVSEKIKLMQRTHGAKETSSVILAFDAAAQERVRYYEEDYDIGIKRYSDMYKNKYLTECRMLYDSKYAKTKTNMYKYLNSTVINSTEILKELLASGISKCHLLAEGINIFEHKEYETQGYTNTAGKNTSEFGDGQGTKTEPDEKLEERSKDSPSGKVKKETKI